MPRNEENLTIVICAECGTQVMSPSLTAGQLLARHSEFCPARPGADPPEAPESSPCGQHPDR